jgi:hypothetical protein
MTAFEFLDHDGLDLGCDFCALLGHSDHRVIGDDASYGCQQLRLDDPGIKFGSDFLCEKIDLLRKGSHDDGGSQLHEQIVGAERINAFHIALPTNIVQKDVVPRGTPIKSAL